MSDSSLGVLFEYLLIYEDNLLLLSININTLDQMSEIYGAVVVFQGGVHTHGRCRFDIRSYTAAGDSDFNFQGRTV